MSESAVVRKLSKVLKSYRADEAATFRNAFQDLLQQGTRTGIWSDQSAKALNAARALYEKWADVPAGSDELGAWLRIYRDLRDHVPFVVLVSLMPRRRKKTAFLATEALLEESDVELLSIITKAKLVDRKDIIRLGLVRPEELYASALFDAVVTSIGKIPDPVWKLIELRTPRGQGRMSAAEVATSYFITSKKPEAAKQVMAFMTVDATADGDLWHALAAEFKASTALAQFAAFQWLHADGKKKPERRSLLLSWCEYCVDEITAGSSLRAAHFATASILLLGVGIDVGPAEDSSHSSLELGERLASSALQAAEERQPSARSYIVAANAEALHAAAHSFLAALHSAEPGSTRGAAYGGAGAKRDLVLDLIVALRGADADLRGGIESALFNAGVRTIGDVGEETTFDPRVHLVSGGAQAGSRVTVMSPGYVIGEGSAPLVLEKALVSASEAHHD